MTDSEVSTEQKTPSAPEDFPYEGPNALSSIPGRVVARLIDVIIVTTPFLLIAIPYLEINGNDVALRELPWWYFPAQLAVGVAYEVLAMWAFRGRTVGKWIMGLRVARFADGHGPTFGQASQRVLLPAVPAAVPNPFIASLQFVIYGTSILNPLLRGWHDRYAGTIVVRTR